MCRDALDCDLFVPTAGRDSLDAETASLLTRIVALLEEVAIETVLENTDRIAQHTRIFRYIIRRGLVSKLGNVGVQLADGSHTTLGRRAGKSPKRKRGGLLWRYAESSAKSDHASERARRSDSLI